MKNACIVLRNCKDGLASLDFACVADAFLSGGYPFSEIRILSSEDEEGFSEAVSGLRSEAENLAVVAERASLVRVGDFLAGLVKAPFAQRTLSGAGIFGEGDFSLFLLSADGGESGRGIRPRRVRSLSRTQVRRAVRPHGRARDGRGRGDGKKAACGGETHERGQIDV